MDYLKFRLSPYEYQTDLADRIIDVGGWSEVGHYGAVGTMTTVPDDENFEEIAYWAEYDYSLVDFYGDLYGYNLICGECLFDAPIIARHTFQNCCQFPTNDRVELALLTRVGLRKYEEYFHLFFNIDAGRSHNCDSYIYMGHFYNFKNGHISVKSNCMATINGFCIDIDQAYADSKKKILLQDADMVITHVMEVLQAHPTMMPNYIMLSGSGIQLWYVFGQAIPLFKKDSPRRQKYKDLLSQVYSWFKDNLRPNTVSVDMSCASLNHAFRAPGSPTKYGFVTRLFKNAQLKNNPSPLELSDFVGGELKEYDLWSVDRWKKDYPQYKIDHCISDKTPRSPATEKQLIYLQMMVDDGYLAQSDIQDDITLRDADELIKSAKAKKAIDKAANKARKISEDFNFKLRHYKLYEYMLRTIPDRSEVGHRYNSLFVLAGIAYACGIPFEKLKEDCKQLIKENKQWASFTSTDGKPLTDEDIEHALKGYNYKGGMRQRSKTEELLGWEFKHTKRNGNPRSVHLKIMNATRNIKIEAGLCTLKGGKPNTHTKERQVREYFNKHPEANNSQAERDLGITRKTVRKWRKVINQDQQSNNPVQEQQMP